MGQLKQTIEKNSSTEEKLKEAARRVFTRKGYAATRTRDIAEESGINLALLNYYFRSKEKLFDIIMQDNMQVFLLSVMSILNEPATCIDEKIELLVSHYIDMLIKNPDMPLFVLHELRTNPQKFVEKMTEKMKVADTCLAEQWMELVKKENIKVNPIHIVMNVAALSIFPFVGSPIIKARTGMGNKQFNELMEERKKLIPMWVKGMMIGN